MIRMLKIKIGFCCSYQYYYLVLEHEEGKVIFIAWESCNVNRQQKK